MRLMSVLCIICLFMVGCQFGNQTADNPEGNQFKLVQDDLKLTSELLIVKLKNIESWTLEIIDQHDQLSFINENEKDDIINKLSELYTSNAASEIFSNHYKQIKEGYQRIPANKNPILDISHAITTEQIKQSDQVIIEISGEMEDGIKIEIKYHIDAKTYKIDQLEIDSPY